MPPPGGRSRSAAAGADLRLDVRCVPGRDHLRAGQGGRAAQRRRGSACSPRHVESEAEETGVNAPEPTPVPVARSRRGRLPRDRAQGRAPREGGRHDHPRRARRREGAAARLPRAEAHGVVGAVPGRRGRLRGAARGPRQAEALRRGAALRARDVAGARVRVPLRVPRAAAHGHREGAAGARVRPRADRHRAQRRVPRDPRRRGRRWCTTPRRCRPRGRYDRVEEPVVFATIITPERSPRRGAGAVPGPPRRDGGHDLHHHRRGWRSTTCCRSRRSSSTSSTS